MWQNSKDKQDLCECVFKNGVVNYLGSNPNHPKGSSQVHWDCSSKVGEELEDPSSQGVVPRPATSVLLGTS